MSDEANRNKGPVGEIVGALATIVLTILGLAHVVPEYCVAIATIIFGATLLLHGSAMLAELLRHGVRASAGSASSAIMGDGGLSAVFLAGAAGISLGVVDIRGVDTHELIAYAVVAYGAALIQLILSASPAIRFLLQLSLSMPNERAQRLASDAFAREMISSSAGIFGLVGLSAIVLGVLAVNGFSPVVLSLIALLALGSVTAGNGIDVADAIVGVYRRS
jgi:hypothetical protein